MRTPEIETSWQRVRDGGDCAHRAERASVGHGSTRALENSTTAVTAAVVAASAGSATDAQHTSSATHDVRRDVSTCEPRRCVRTRKTHRCSSCGDAASLAHSAVSLSAWWWHTLIRARTTQNTHVHTQPHAHTTPANHPASSLCLRSPQFRPQPSCHHVLCPTSWLRHASRPVCRRPAWHAATAHVLPGHVRWSAESRGPVSSHAYGHVCPSLHDGRSAAALCAVASPSAAAATTTTAAAAATATAAASVERETRGSSRLGGIRANFVDVVPRFNVC